ncbi:death-associated protein kinase 3-like [Aplochiton taeniatus]
MVFYRLLSTCMRPHGPKAASPTPEAKKTTPTTTTEPPRALKTGRLKDYTIHSHSSLPPNHSYADCQRLAHLAEEASQVEAGLAGVAEAHRSLQGDLQALLSIYGEKGPWYKEEGEAARKRLSRVRYEFRKVEATRQLLQEEMAAVDASLEDMGGRRRQRQEHLRSLRQELLAQLQWMQEVMGSLQAEGAGGQTHRTHLSQEVGQALKELLSMACGGELCPGPDAKQSRAESGSPLGLE